MKQPFDLKYIRRYLLLYLGIVIVMIVFYFLNHSNNPVQSIEKKEFSTLQAGDANSSPIEQTETVHDIRLLEKIY